MMHVVERFPCPGPSPGQDVWCCFCYENLRRRANHQGHRWYVSPPKPKFVDWSTMFKKVVLPGSIPVEGFDCSDKKFLADFPTLAQGMNDPWGSDSKPRQLWSISIRMDGSSVQVTLTDKGLKASAYTTAPTLHQALKLMNSAAETDTLTFRRWQDKK